MKLLEILAGAAMAATAHAAALSTGTYENCTLYNFVTTGTDKTVTVYKTTRVSTYSAHCFGCTLLTTTVPGSVTYADPLTITASSQFAWKTVCAKETIGDS